MDSITTGILVDDEILAYSKVAMLTLLGYDYFLSLAQEIAYVWSSKWGLVKVLYLISRYSPFIDTILVVEERLNLHVSDVSCHRTTAFTTIISCIGIGISDLILIVRTYAMYRHSRRALIALIILWVAIFAVNLPVIVRWTNSFSEVDLSVEIPGIPSCSLLAESSIGLTNYISLLVGETVVVAMTLWKAIRDYDRLGFSDSATQNVSMTFYRDGVLFYLFILPITLGNVLVLAFAPPTLQVLDTPLRVMHSILCCRLVIHLREVADADLTDIGSEEILSDIAFQCNTTNTRESLV